MNGIHVAEIASAVRTGRRRKGMGNDMKKWLEEMLHFGIIGVFNTLLGLVLNLVFYNVLHWNFWVATGTSYTIGSIFSYFANKKLTFKVEESSWQSALRFAGNILVCYLLAYGIAKPAVAKVMAGYASALSEKTGIEAKAIVENVAMLFGMGLFIVFNFLGQKFFVFKEKGKEAANEAH